MRTLTAFVFGLLLGSTALVGIVMASEPRYNPKGGGTWRS